MHPVNVPEGSHDKPPIYIRNCKLRPIKSLFHDAREREFITHLRDFCDDYGTPKARKIPLQKDVASRVEALNSGRVHAGNALADAGMFIAREPFNAMAQFRRVYGINPQQIQALDTFNSLLRVLDAVGASRYQARTMRKRACSSISSSSSSEGDCRKAEEMVKSAIDQEMFYRPFVSCPEGDDIENEG